MTRLQLLEHIRVAAGCGILLAALGGFVFNGSHDIVAGLSASEVGGIVGAIASFVLTRKWRFD